MDMQALHTMCSTPKRLGVRANDYIKHPILLGEVTIILCMCLHSKLHIITHVATKVHVILGRNHIGGRQVELRHVTGRGPCLLAPLAANGRVVLLSWQGLTPLASTRGRRLYSYPPGVGPLSDTLPPCTNALRPPLCRRYKVYYYIKVSFELEGGLPVPASGVGYVIVA